MEELLAALINQINAIPDDPSTALRQGSGHCVGQGVVMGLNNSFSSVGHIAGPIWAGFIFDVNVNSTTLTSAAQ